MKIKAFIHENEYTGSPYVFAFDATDSGYILMGTHEFEFEPPADYDPVAAKIGMLQKGLKKIEREHDVQVANIKKQIEKLQCLEFKPS